MNHKNSQVLGVMQHTHPYYKRIPAKLALKTSIVAAIAALPATAVITSSFTVIAAVGITAVIVTIAASILLAKVSKKVDSKDDKDEQPFVLKGEETHVFHNRELNKYLICNKLIISINDLVKNKKKTLNLNELSIPISNCIEVDFTKLIDEEKKFVRTVTINTLNELTDDNTLQVYKKDSEDEFTFFLPINGAKEEYFKLYPTLGKEKFKEIDSVINSLSNDIDIKSKNSKQAANNIITKIKNTFTLQQPNDRCTTITSRIMKKLDENDNEEVKNFTESVFKALKSNGYIYDYEKLTPGNYQVTA